MKICHIYAAGECGELTLPSGVVFTIAADGGLDTLLRNFGKDFRPNLAVGDFDSFGGDLSLYNDCEVVKLPCEKDETDTEAAARLALERGAGHICFFGVLGGRIDHTIANLQLAAALSKKGVRVFIYGKNEKITFITDGAKVFEQDSERCRRISVFAATEVAEGVSIRGLKYQLGDAVLRNDRPLGVSNEYIGQAAEISVRKGTLMIVEDFGRA